MVAAAPAPDLRLDGQGAYQSDEKLAALRKAREAIEDHDPAHSPPEQGAIGRDLMAGDDPVIDIRGLWDKVAILADQYEEDVAMEEQYAITGVHQLP